MIVTVPHDVAETPGAGKAAEVHGALEDGDFVTVLGKAVSKQTPAFRGDMRYVEMSPYWNVPYSIAVNELLPALEARPDDAGLQKTARSTVTAEAIVLAFVVVTTASLVAAAI